MDEALAWKRGRQVVPNLLWVFRPLTTTPSSWRVSSDWPGHCTSPPGFQLVHSLLCQSQQEALSDASPSLWTAAFLKWPLSPTFVNKFHTDCAGNPRHPTSTVISHVVHPLSRQSWTSCWYLPFFLSAASSQPSSHGTINSTRMTFSPSGDYMIMSWLRVVDNTASGKWSFLLRSTSISHAWADCKRFCLSWLWTTGLWPSFTKTIVLGSGLALAGCFFLLSCCRMSASTANTLSWRHLYLPCVNAILHPDRMCTIVPFLPHNLHSGSSSSPTCAN